MEQDAQKRKGLPVITGVLDYFPDALLAIAEVSKVGNDQHNPGQPMHWSRDKSNDHADCVGRHLIDRGKIDTDGMRHTAKAAWRVLALLQLELENAELDRQTSTWRPINSAVSGTLSGGTLPIRTGSLVNNTPRTVTKIGPSSLSFVQAGYRVT